MERLSRFRFFKKIFILKYVKAFTLAEVLITLGIIGVVASLTIPTLMQNVQDNAFHNAWKKSYSIIAQAQQYVLNDNNFTYKNLCGDFNDTCFRDNFSKYLKIVKSCDGNASLGDCWANPSVTSENFPSVVLSDGVALMFRYEKSDCNYIEEVAPRCGWIRVDVNGAKGPNSFGKDIFTIRVLSDRITPAKKEDADDCKTNPTSEACSAYFLYH